MSFPGSTGGGKGISFPSRLLLGERVGHLENATSPPCPESTAPGSNPELLQDPLHPRGIVLTCADLHLKFAACFGSVFGGQES